MHSIRINRVLRHFMTTDSAFAIRLLEKIGTPLVTAIESAPPTGSSAEIGAAEMMAKMLGQAVQISIKLATTLNAQETEEQADSTRLSMAAIATPLLANFYIQNKRVPEEADINRILKSLEAVIGFADKFTPAADGQSRLSTIDNDIAFFDQTQAILTTAQALVPALLAISEFSFGKSDTKLMQEVAAKLEEKAQQLAGGTDNKLGQILVLKSLATIYAQCHSQEVAKMSAGNSDNNTAPSITPVWEAFEKRTMMMQALVGMDIAETTVDGGASQEPPLSQEAQNLQQDQQNSGQNPEQNSEQNPQQPQQTASQNEQMPVEQAAPPPPQQDTPAAAPQSAAPAAGPMGFFKPGANKDNSSSPAASTPAPTTKAPVESSPEPLADSKEKPKDTTASDFDDNSAAPPPPSNPMGFFKPGTQKKEDE